MSLKKLGERISPIDIHTSAFGIWLLLNNVEYFLSYKDYPWFSEAKISELYNVELLHNTHLYWPAMDIDLDLASLKNPEKYPLIYHSS